jgi:hypothetical protein
MNMKKAFEVNDDVMEKINRLAVKELSKDEVYCFSVLLCDNEVDRDYESFTVESLETLAEMFVGRTGIFDHNPKGENQNARIFDCEVKRFPEKLTAAGEEYCALMGYAYMVRTDENRSLIAEIDGGIKKEVSVGCAVESRICSVCGQDVNKQACAHSAGKYYGERLCFYRLENPTDAYEWSFVAVPAQRNAGVVKRYVFEGDDVDLQAREKLVRACEELRGDIIGLSYFVRPGVSAKRVELQTEGLDFYKLLAEKKRLESEIRECGSRTCAVSTDVDSVHSAQCTVHSYCVR